ncbi:MAG: transposase domain-containing protein [Alphaproteobacteria bacterium]
MTEWFTAAELAALRLPDLPVTESAVIRVAKREKWREERDTRGAPLARRRAGRGGGWEYHRSLLPARALQRLVADEVAERVAAEPAADERGIGELWDWYERLPEKRRAVAKRRVALLDAVDALVRAGLAKNVAVAEVARQNDVGASSIYRWFGQVERHARDDWPPLLAPQHSGRTATAECAPEAWQFFKELYLSPSRRPLEVCYDDLQRVAAEAGWTVPSAQTLRRRIERELPAPVVTYWRKGKEALWRMFPPQERDRTMFHALEAVNVDGHRWDVFVRWPDGTVARPIMVAIQDLYSNKILGWRIDRTENTDLVRLVFKDVFEQYGIPDRVWLDNGRAFASKYLTGQSPNRYRFKIKAEEPVGILTGLGIEIHWASPYRGQSKPIERAFGDLCNTIATHAAFEGAYTGNSPEAKPENYGSRAVELEEFIRVASAGLALHNARTGRKTKVCGGTLSFDQAFERSYAQHAIRRARPEQLREFLLAAELVRANREHGSVRLLGNRYWGAFLHAHLGDLLTVRFDPDNLHDGVHVYRHDGRYLGFADCLEAAGFANAEDARKQAAARKAWLRATREVAELERQLSAPQVAARLAAIEVEEPEPPEAKVLRPLAFGNTAIAAAPEAAPQIMSDDERLAALNHGLTLLEGGRAD